MVGPNAYRLLLISSADEAVDATPERVLRRQMKALQENGVDCQFVIDPSQNELEILLLSNRYDGVLPLALYLDIRDEITGRFSVPLLLEQMEQPVIGCSHYVQLLTLDKTVTLHRSGCGVPGALLTKTMFQRRQLPRAVNGDLDFPLFVKPNALCASIGIGRDNVVADPDALFRKAGELFLDARVEECRLEKDKSRCRQFTVALVGNSPALAAGVIELVYPAETDRVYDRQRKETHMRDRDLRYALVDEPEMRAELEYYAAQAFRHLGMRDYARMDFFWDGEPLLHDVNSHPTIGNSFSFEWAQYHQVPTENLLAFPLAAFHFRQLADGQASPLPTGVLELLPPSILARLERPRPVTAPPEYTRPHDGCLVPERFRAVDGTAVELEVLRFLEMLVELTKPDLIVETGTYLGSSAAALAKGLSTNGTGRLVTIECIEVRAETARARLRGQPVEVICGSSLDYHPSGPVDLLFLDSHRVTREQEFRHFLPYLHARSIIVWHDSAAHHPGVPQALARLHDEGLLAYITLPTPRGISLSMQAAGRP